MGFGVIRPWAPCILRSCDFKVHNILFTPQLCMWYNYVILVFINKLSQPLISILPAKGTHKMLKLNAWWLHSHTVIALFTSRSPTRRHIAGIAIGYYNNYIAVTARGCYISSRYIPIIYAPSTAMRRAVLHGHLPMSVYYETVQSDRVQMQPCPAHQSVEDDYI